MSSVTHESSSRPGLRVFPRESQWAPVLRGFAGDAPSIKSGNSPAAEMSALYILICAHRSMEQFRRRIRASGEGFPRIRENRRRALALPRRISR